MARLKGKVAIVTGASKGIGSSIAEKLAEEGAAVAVNYARSGKEAESVVERIRAKGGKAVAIQGDVSRRADVQKLFETTQKELGPIDVLVNNAGVYEFRPITDIDEEHVDRHFNLNVRGLLFATQEAVRAFGDRGGSIINVSSTIVESPVANASVYGATKGAVDMISKSLAQELGPKKIAVNSVSPGLTETEGLHAMEGVENITALATSRTPLGRAGKPEDIANVVAFVASPEAGWITGQVIGVNGGLRL